MQKVDWKCIELITNVFKAYNTLLRSNQVSGKWSVVNEYCAFYDFYGPRENCLVKQFHSLFFNYVCIYDELSQSNSLQDPSTLNKPNTSNSHDAHVKSPSHLCFMYQLVCKPQLWRIQGGKGDNRPLPTLTACIPHYFYPRHL